MEIINIITFVGFILVSAYLFFGKHFIKSYAAKSGENLATKKDIAEITDKVESVKKDYEIIKLTHQIKFTNLHEKRMLVIEEFYKKLIYLHSMAAGKTAQVKLTNKPKEQFEAEQERLGTEVVTAYQSCYDYYLNHKLFFSEGEQNLIEGLRKDYRKNVNAYLQREIMWNNSNGNYSEKETERIGREADEASQYIATEIPKILNLLEKEFQKFFGMIE